MKLVPYDASKLTRIGYKVAKLQAILEEFEKSGEKCVHVADHGYVNAKGCYSALRVAVRRFHMDNIQVATRKGEVYLIRKE